MTAKFYAPADKYEQNDVIELPTYFHEDLTFDVNQTKLKFASQKQVDDLNLKSQSRLKEQKKKITGWLSTDRDLTFDAYFDFTLPNDAEQAEVFQVFSSSTQESEKNREELPLTKNAWKVNNLKNIHQLSGCDLTQRVAKVLKPINIRSRAFTININFVLCGESSLNIITRSKQDNEETTVIKFLKTGKGAEQRLFLYFGILDRKNKDVVYIKRTEVPIMLTDEVQIKNNFLEVSCSIHDNGDQFLIVSGEINGCSRYHFKAKYEQIIPYFEDFNLYMFGEKDNVIVKKLRLKLIHRERDMFMDPRMMQGKCCSIF